MQLGAGGRRKTRRRGQPAMPKRQDHVDEHPFRKTTSGFESLIPRSGAEDFFFSQLLADPEHAAEFFEHGGDDREPLLGDPRVGVAFSAVLHVFLVIFLLVDPMLADFLGPREQPEQEVAEVDREEPLVLFMEEPQPPLVAATPVVPVVPVPAPQPEPAQPRPNDNSLIIPKAMLPPDTPSQAMDDLPFSRGNTEEFYTDEEVKEPGTEGDAKEEVEPETAVAEDNGEGDEDSERIEGAADGSDTVKVADNNLDPREVGELLFRERLPQPESAVRQQDEQRRRALAREPQLPLDELGEGGENGRFTDIRRFLATARFHHPEGGLVVAGRDNTLYYNDKGANFVPWIRRMLAEVRRTWIASMPYAANVYAGHTAVGFTVARDGSVVALETLVRSGVPGFDNNAEGAVRGARLLPLPGDYPDETFDIVIVFWVNERPYDIFG